jgi:hypothetical protein
MKYFYSRSSLDKLYTCHLDLQTILLKLIEVVDVKIIWGWRGEELQNQFFEAGTSEKAWPNSLHNTLDKDNKPCSLAVDIAPYYPQAPHIRWNDHEGFIYVAGYFMGIAHMLDIKVRNGNDWDGDNNLHNQRFFDRGHFELRRQ